MAAKKISVGGRRFLLEWTSANAVALGAGWAVTGAMQRSRMQPYYETVTSAARAVRLEAPSLGTALAVLGTLVGTAQWWCLRRRLHVSAWWVPATGLGWALFGVVMGVLSGIFGSSVSGIGPFVRPRWLSSWDSRQQSSLRYFQGRSRDSFCGAGITSCGGQWSVWPVSFLA